jgi:hypothetical protein
VVGVESVLLVFDRRGGGTLGLTFSSFTSSCSSLADLKDEGDDGVFWLSMDVENLLLCIDGDCAVSCDLGGTCREPLCTGGFGGGVVVLIPGGCAGFCFAGGDFTGSFLGVLKYGRSSAPFVERGGGRSTLGLGLGLTGGGVLVLVLCSGAVSVGSGGSLNARCGLGDRTGGGDLRVTCKGSVAGLVGVVGLVCSNIFTKELVGGIGVSSVGLSWSVSRAVLAMDCDPRLSLLFRGCCLGPLVSSLASTFPTLPDGGIISLSSACRSLIVGAGAGAGAAAGWGFGRRGLPRAAANLAAMLDGEGVRSMCSPGTLSEFELVDLERFGLLTPAEPPVKSLGRAIGLPPVPTFVAASKAPLFPPVYVFVGGFDFGDGLEKARAAPRRAASRTLCCVSPVVCGTRPW